VSLAAARERVGELGAKLEEARDEIDRLVEERDALLEALERLSDAVRHHEEAAVVGGLLIEARAASAKVRGKE
jgi:hypothetical protein